MKNYLSYSIIALSFVLMVVGCNSEKRAMRHIHKAERIDETVPPKYCAAKYPATDSINERTIFIPGKTITDTVETTNLEIIQDTVYITKLKTINNKKTDTLHISKFERQQNTAAIKAMQDIQDRLNQNLHEAQTDLAHYKAEAKRLKKNNTTIGIIVACYIAFKILMLWLSTKFPASKIVNVVRKVF